MKYQGLRHARKFCSSRLNSMGARRVNPRVRMVFLFPQVAAMKTSLLSLCFVAIAVFPPLSDLFASPASNETSVIEGQVASGLALPFWGEGECRENFEVRIWPQSVMIWLEEENLRTIISDPSTPEEEKQYLKRLLALQRAWRVHS